jgi:hypothetical protein
LPGSSPSEVVGRFVHAIQQTLSCITGAVLVRSHDSTKPGGVRTIMAPSGGRFARLADPHDLHLSVTIDYEIVAAEEAGRRPWKITTRRYMHHVVADAHDEVALFHWHPDSSPAPHMHLGSSQLTPSAVISHKMHVPAGRVSLEAVCRWLISDLDVHPRRDDWREVLDENEARFIGDRTWR